MRDPPSAPKWVPDLRTGKNPARTPACRRSRDDDKHQHVPLISMDYTRMSETDDESNNPILVTHDSLSEGIWEAFAKREGTARVSRSEQWISSRGWGFSKSR